MAGFVAVKQVGRGFYRPLKVGPARRNVKVGSVTYLINQPSNPHLFVTFYFSNFIT